MRLWLSATKIEDDAVPPGGSSLCDPPRGLGGRRGGDGGGRGLGSVRARRRVAQPAPRLRRVRRRRRRGRRGGPPPPPPPPPRGPPPPPPPPPPRRAAPARGAA